MLTVDFDLINVQEGHLVLDAGCGWGRHSVEFQKHGATLFSMDLDIESLKITRDALENGGTPQSSRMVHIGDALRMPFRDNTFDRIICSEVMEHVPDKVQAARELFRILKPGGIIAITVPTPFSEALYFLLTYEYFTSPGGHVRIFTPRSLAKLMRTAGFKLYALRYKHAFHSIWWAIRSVVGLHDEQQFFTRTYRTFLTLGFFSPLMKKTESFFDWFFPKSLIFYAKK
jgi:ubiquinone/menaquinone biosynthesis C-methylase UbiE